ncbi:tetraacyldisaccharide 4'-kinase [uncultured Polaribacter sp.]|uniref:tetraacyldisaccharide 4'-kinase n=1 Tax=uncultured Polaribacter sp. TaxID=174711 RepID=UPI002604AE82|nr:tetraacyldisaccharide 4'-kinase [uncultured Polaribacter sp.]
MKKIRFLLFPFTLIYDLVTRIRNLFFDFGIFKQTSFKIPVIVVGNLSVGGTGKTPQIEYLIRLLQNDFKTSVLSRGYKRKTKGFILLNNTHTATEVGDEPLQYFKKFNKISVAVDEDRVHGVKQLLAQKKPDVVLLDDAYQHRKVKGSFYILLTKYQDLFIDDFLLPTGNLRENRAGANRSTVILITKCPLDLAVKEQQIIRKRFAQFNKQIFFTGISYGTLVLGDKEFAVNELESYNVLLVTGIANPKPLVNYLDGLQVNFKHLVYSDHHHFSETDILAIQNQFQEIKSSKKIILTTEKDYVRLKGSIENLSYLPIKTSFLNDQSLIFNALIDAHLKENN